MLKHCLIVFLVSMVPVIELRGAIPYGVGFGAAAVLTYCVATAGNMLPVPVIYFFARRVLVWGSGKPVIGKLFAFFLEKGERAGQKLQKKAGRGLYWALLLFVGIPLRAPARGPVRWRPAFWIWTSRRACWPVWAAYCWRGSSWGC